MYCDGHIVDVEQLQQENYEDVAEILKFSLCCVLYQRQLQVLLVALIWINYKLLKFCLKSVLCTLLNKTIQQLSNIDVLMLVE